VRLQSELFIPGDGILAEGSGGDRLCILHEGAAAAFWTKAVASVAVLVEGALFGEVAFFVKGMRRLVTVRATTACDVLFISKQDWEELWLGTGDASDSQVQRYPMHSILSWVCSGTIDDAFMLGRKRESSSVLAVTLDTRRQSQKQRRAFGALGWQQTRAKVVGAYSVPPKPERWSKRHRTC
jgi:CRP-like cAMP-binding protein